MPGFAVGKKQIWEGADKGCVMSDLDRAVESLTSLGLSKYEAEVFAALSALGEATASEVHEESGVPRSSVYDVLDRLVEKGWVEKSRSRPFRYHAEEPERAVEAIAEERRRNEEEAVESLEALGRGEGQERSAIWSLEGDRVLDRARELVASADRIRMLDGEDIAGELEPALERDADSVEVVPQGELRRLSGDGEENLEATVLIGDERVLITFEENGVRTGVWTDSPGMMRFYEYLFGRVSRGAGVPAE